MLFEGRESKIFEGGKADYLSAGNKVNCMRGIRLFEGGESIYLKAGTQDI